MIEANNLKQLDDLFYPCFDATNTFHIVTLEFRKSYEG